MMIHIRSAQYISLLCGKSFHTSYNSHMCRVAKTALPPRPTNKAPHQHQFTAPLQRAFSSKAKDTENADGGSRTLGILFLGSIVAGTAGLGIWQTKRYYEKIELIEARKSKLSQPPQKLPPWATAKSLIETSGTDYDAEYSPFKVEGTFLHDHEILIGPRSPPKSVFGPATGLGTNPSGVLTITPLRRPDGSLILVNRGWTPKSNLSSRSQTNDEVTLCVVSMKGEQKAKFTPDNDEAAGLFFWIDHDFLSQRVSHLAPKEQAGKKLAILEEVKTGQREEWPASRTLEEFEQFHVMPETHFVYAVTWYSLAIFGTVATWLRFRKRPGSSVFPKKTFSPPSST